jgi:endonuclease IV
LEVFHFNDSRKDESKKLDAPFCSCKDRHQNLGEGYIFGSEKRIKEIITFMMEASKHGIPVIGEPPNDGVSDWLLVEFLLHKTSKPLIIYL